MIKKQFTKSKAFQGKKERLEREQELAKKEHDIRIKQHLHLLAQKLHTLPTADDSAVKSILLETFKQTLGESNEHLCKAAVDNIDAYTEFFIELVNEERELRAAKLKNPTLKLKPFKVKQQNNLFFETDSIMFTSLDNLRTCVATLIL